MGGVRFEWEKMEGNWFGRFCFTLSTPSLDLYVLDNQDRIEKWKMRGRRFVVVVIYKLWNLLEDSLLSIETNLLSCLLWSILLSNFEVFTIISVFSSISLSGNVYY